MKWILNGQLKMLIKMAQRLRGVNTNGRPMKIKHPDILRKKFPDTSGTPAVLPVVYPWV